jgi:hypothetical protein
MLKLYSHLLTKFFHKLNLGKHEDHVPNIKLFNFGKILVEILIGLTIFVTVLHLFSLPIYLFSSLFKASKILLIVIIITSFIVVVLTTYKVIRIVHKNFLLNQDS